LVGSSNESLCLSTLKDVDSSLETASLMMLWNPDCADIGWEWLQVFSVEYLETGLITGDEIASLIGYSLRTEKQFEEAVNYFLQNEKYFNEGTQKQVLVRTQINIDLGNQFK